MGQDKFHGTGGSYVANEKGELEQVQRTSQPGESAVNEKVAQPAEDTQASEQGQAEETTMQAKTKGK